MIGVDTFASVFGGAPAHTAEHLIEHLRAVIRAGYSPVLCKPGGKETACILSAAQARKADREAQAFKLAADPTARVDRIRHACGMRHVIDDPAKVGPIVKRFLDTHGGLNVALHLGRSRMIVVDVDTPEERTAFVDQWPVPGPGYENVSTSPGITVESPGSFDVASQTWKHWGGGHWWMPVPEGYELPPGKVLKGPGGWAAMYGESYVLVPPATRAEGSYRLVGGTTAPPSWLLVKMALAGADRANDAESRQRHAGQVGGPIDAWSAATPWASLLEPHGWTETSMVEGSCGCPVWTAPGVHASPKSATAHDLSCQRFDVSEGWGPLKIWTDHPPDGLPAEGAVTKLQFVAAMDHGGDDGAAIRSLGIGTSAPAAWAVPIEWTAAAPSGVLLNGAGQDVSRSTHQVADVITNDPFGTPGGPPPDPSEPLAAQGEAPLSSWDTVDLGPFLDGTYRPPRPALLHRSDGLALFYPGLTHAVYGETESAKSWIVLLACAQEIRAGRHVLMIDLESDPGFTVHRLRLMGCTPDEIKALFHYVGPWAKPSTEDDLQAWFWRTLNRPYSLAVIDAMSGALGLYGLKSKDDDDITTFYRAMPELIVQRTGAAVVTVDHVIKDKETRGRWPSGSERKVSALTGAAFSVRRSEPFGEGQRGSSEVWIAKDRAGGLRGHAGASDRDGMQQIGVFLLDSSSPAVFTCQIDPPPVDEDEREQSVAEAIRVELIAHPGSTTSAIRSAVAGRSEVIAQVLAGMVADGSVIVETHGRSHLHRLNIDDMSDSTYGSRDDDHGNDRETAGQTPKSPYVIN